MPSLGFGLERIGLTAIRWPFAVFAVLLALSVVCAFGTARLKTNHTLSELFRSSTVDFANYKKLSALFPTSEFDVLVVVEGPDLMKPEILDHGEDVLLPDQLAFERNDQQGELALAIRHRQQLAADQGMSECPLG